MAEATSRVRPDAIDRFEDLGEGPLPGAYGQDEDGVGAPETVDPSIILQEAGFLSLPTGTNVTVRYDGQVIVDGDGDDIFVSEFGDEGEKAIVFVGGGDGMRVLGTIDAGQETGLDLADIDWDGYVTHIMVVGIDSNGTSPGFDLMEVSAASSSVVSLDAKNNLTGNPDVDTIDLGDRADIFRAGTGNDDVRGGNGNDKIKGQGGDDVLRGNAGADILNGGGGFDTILGNEGNDILRGGSGFDSLIGGKGADKLRGGGDIDVLEGGKGRDILSGGSGADTFVFNGNAGRDRITDFNVDEDTIAINGFDGLDLTVTANAKGVRLEVGDLKVQLAGVSQEEIDAINFDFG